MFVLRKIGKLSLGVATFVPLLYMAAFLGLGVYMAGTAHSKQSDALMFRLFPLIITMHMAVGFLWMALYAYYIVHVFRQPLTSDASRVRWAILIQWLGFFTMPIYWFLYVWPDSHGSLTEAVDVIPMEEVPPRRGPSLSVREKVLLTIGTFWPLITTALLLIRAIDPALQAFLEEDSVARMPSFIFELFPPGGNLLIFLAGACGLATWVYYLVDLTRRRMPGALKGTWLVLLIFGNIGALLPYWWLYIRPIRTRPVAGMESAMSPAP